jgi:hypothetical protein
MIEIFFIVMSSVNVGHCKAKAGPAAGLVVFARTDDGKRHTVRPFGGALFLAVLRALLATSPAPGAVYHSLLLAVVAGLPLALVPTMDSIRSSSREAQDIVNVIGGIASRQDPGRTERGCGAVDGRACVVGGARGGHHAAAVSRGVVEKRAFSGPARC